jgi:soluble lytic murein transglycosylase-like protein
MRNLLYGILILFVLGILLVSGFTESEKPVERTIPESREDITLSGPPCVQMYECIEKYAEMYGVPKQYAFGIAYQETRYRGLTDWEYDHRQISSASALGPMQILYSTAKGLWPKENFTKEKLRDDIDFNVETSMKFLARLYDRYHDWKIVFGYYNTGYPKVNDYAIKVVNYKL